HLLALLSFPTRRSSDLIVQAAGHQQYLTALARQWSDCLTGHVQGGAQILAVGRHDVRAEGAEQVGQGGVVVAQRGDAMGTAGIEDRKSTRLNSSHVKIS